MLLGCICVVHANNSGHEEQIQDGYNGFIVDMKKQGWNSKVSEIRAMGESKINEISQNARRSAFKNGQRRQQKTEEMYDWASKLFQ